VEYGAATYMQAGAVRIVQPAQYAAPTCTPYMGILLLQNCTLDCTRGTGMVLWYCGMDSHNELVGA